MRRVILYEDGTIYATGRTPKRYGIARLSATEQTYDIEVNATSLQDNDRPQLGPPYGKGHTIPVLPPVMEYVKKINTPTGYRYARSLQNLISNRRYVGDDLGPPYKNDNGDPFDAHMMAECIGFPGNFYHIIGETVQHVELNALRYDTPTAQFNPRAFNYRYYPDRFAACSARDRQGNMYKVQSGIDCFFPTLKFREHLWMPKEYMEMFPEPPYTVVVKASGKQVTIIDHILYETSVFGVLPTLEKIYLLKATKPGEREFPTTFELDTVGVIPPK